MDIKCTYAEIKGVAGDIALRDSIVGRIMIVIVIGYRLPNL